MGRRRGDEEADADYEVHPAARLFPMLGAAELRALADDIAANGQQEPVVLLGGRVLDGRNRLRACRIAGVEPLVCSVAISEADAVPFVLSANLHRRHLTTRQRAHLAAELLPLFRSDAKDRQRQGGKLRAKLPEAERPRERAARLLQVSPRAVQNAARIAVLDPEAHARAKAGLAEARTCDAVRAIREASKQTPRGRFNVLVVDPPWPYSWRSVDPSHRAMPPYPPMQVKDILALPIARLAAEDAVLWLWVTNAHLRTAFRCLDQWGFRERGLLTWDKVHMGLGDLLRGQTEHVVIATRGSPRFNREAAKRTTTLLREPKTRAHSRKPAGFYALVERLCFGKRAELFAREKREGWTALLSPEVDKFLGRTGPS